MCVVIVSEMYVTRPQIFFKVVSDGVQLQNPAQVDHAAADQRQHQRAGDHDRRSLRGFYPRHGLTRSAEIDPCRLQVDVFLDGVQRLVAAEARLLDAAERHGDVGAAIGVYMHDTGIDGAHHAVRRRQV